MGHPRHEGAELRQPIGLEQLALQQDLPRHVHGEEQQLGRRLDRIDVHDDRLHVAHRIPGERQVELLTLTDRLPQRGGEPRPLRLGGPLRKGAPADGGRVRPS